MNTEKNHINSLMDRYLEGVLSVRETDELFRLLNEGSYDPEDHLSGELPVLRPEEVTFRLKNTLHKTYSEITEAQFETLCIAEIEGDLSFSQSKEILNSLASNPEKKKVYNSFLKLRLEPGTVVYQHKSRLKKLTLTGRLARFSAVTLSMAATIAIIMIAFNFFSTSVEEPLKSPIAEQSANIERPVNVAPKIISNEFQARYSEPVISTVTGRQKESTLKMPVSEVDPARSEEIIEVTPERITMPDPASLAFGSPVSYPHVNPGMLADMSLDSPQSYQSPSLRENIATNFRELFLGDKDPDGTPLKGYEIAGAGINGLNKLLGWEMDLEAKKETTGEVNALAFNSRLIKIQAPVKRAEPDEEY